MTRFTRSGWDKQPIDWPLVAIASVLGVCFAVLLAAVVWFVYCLATGGTSYSDRQKIGGVECIVIHDRLTGAPEHVSCPVQK